MGTRYADYPTYSVLLVRRVDAPSHQVSLTLSDGQDLAINLLKPNPWAVCQLYRNLLTVPVWRFQDFRRSGFAEKLFHDLILVLVIGEDGTLHYDDQPTGLAYDDLRGLTEVSGTSDADPTRRRAFTDFDNVDNNEDFLDGPDW